MVRKAASFIIRNGPVTQQDRWEEDAGYSPFTLAAEISALLAAADIAELTGHSEHASDSCAITPTPGTTTSNAGSTPPAAISPSNLASKATTSASPRPTPMPPLRPRKASSPSRIVLRVKHGERAYHIISPDALALVRFGLRAADDPRILNTFARSTRCFAVELPQGPCWYRYNGDGYGEHKDGSAFDGTGIGRPWPLLAGERAHYALAAGHREEAEALLTVMENSTTGHSRLLPEQVWDADDIPALELFRGKPTGSACPLVWAHSEYIKLRRSMRDGKIFDQPPQTVQRYLVEKPIRQIFGWRFNNKTRSVPRYKKLRLVLMTPAVVHWSIDDWKTSQDTPTRDTGLDTYILDLPTASLPVGAQVTFTFYWPQENRWEGKNYVVVVE